MKDIAIFKIWIYNGNNTPLKERKCNKVFVDMQRMEDYRDRIRRMYESFTGCEISVFFGYTDPNIAEKTGKRFDRATSKSPK